jgi:spermidine/putrescine transport system substrate-binding protein
MPGGSAVEVMVKTGLIEPLNWEWIPNAETVYPRFQNSKADPDHTYALANDWSFHGIGYRRDLVDEEITGWSDLWRLKEKYDRKITVLDNDRDTIGSTLKMLGYSYNSTTESEIDEAVDKLLELKPHLLAVTATNQREMLLSGQAVLTMDWNQSIAGANREDENAQFVVPEEGSGWYADYLVIPKGGNSSYTAHTFMNFLHEPPNYAAFVEFATTPWTNENCVELLPDWLKESPWLQESLVADPLEMQVDVGDASRLYDAAWTKFKAA